MKPKTAKWLQAHIEWREAHAVHKEAALKMLPLFRRCQETGQKNDRAWNRMPVDEKEAARDILLLLNRSSGQRGIST